MSTKFALILLAALAVACGGGASTATNRPSAGGPPAASTAPGQPTPLVVEEGEPIEREHVLAAFEALESVDSWTFTTTYWVKGSTENFEQTITGTERRNPAFAIDAIHEQPDGDEYRYIRVEDDIWTDVATGEFFHSDAAGSENLIEQYEPYYGAALVDDAAGGGSLEFEPVGIETVNSRPAMHYTLSENDRENAVQFLDIEPSQFAGEIWIAIDGGHLVALAWGPQSKETAGSTMGFRYDVTSVNCECPIEAPE